MHSLITQIDIKHCLCNLINCNNGAVLRRVHSLALSVLRFYTPKTSTYFLKNNEKKVKIQLNINCNWDTKKLSMVCCQLFAWNSWLYNMLSNSRPLIACVSKEAVWIINITKQRFNVILGRFPAMFWRFLLFVFQLRNYSSR